MIKKIELMGISLDNYPAREAMILMETFLNNTVLNTIEEVSVRMLLEAKNDEMVHRSIEELDLAIPGDEEILMQADYGQSQQMRDIKSNAFFHEFARRVIRNKKSVFLLGENEEDLTKLRKYLENHYPLMNIIGDRIFEDNTECANIVNDINALTPEVILSVLPSPRQEWFILGQKSRIHAKIWYGMNDYYKKGEGAASFKEQIGKWLWKIDFRRRMKVFSSK